MRFDTVGMFWQDTAKEKKGQVTRSMPPIPETGWKTPTTFPNLSTASLIALDVETYDPDLLEYGPGWGRGVGNIVGVSIGVDGGKWYFPTAHTVCENENMDPAHVYGWLSHTLSNPKQPKVGANILYDLGWLAHTGIEVKGPVLDVQFAEALLSESSAVNLETLAQKYLGLGKESDILYDWCARFYGGSSNHKQRANIYRAPPSLVGPYAESDADLPLRLLPLLYEALKKEGMVDLFYMECRLIPLLLKMRMNGVQVNVDKAEQLKEDLTKRIEIEKKKLKTISGVSVDPNSSDSMVKAFTNAGIEFSKTAKGNASFTKQFLKSVDHPLAKSVLEVRRLTKLRDTFVQSYVLDSHIDGRVYGQFHSLRGDEDGTRSGRFSSSTPNLQNIPSRDDELAPLVRGLFEPTCGHAAWRKYDYSQIEYRFLIHFALGPRSDEVRELFNLHPDTDYHEMALDLVGPEAGWDISTPDGRKHWRRPVKNINFGLIYGMGVDKLSRDLGLNQNQGKELFAAYHRAVPFAKATMDYYSKHAMETGSITTILGRKSRFDLWEPQKWGRDTIALPLRDAIMRYGSIRRAHTHKALNRLLQGSAADLMKKAMLDCYEQGIFDETGIPVLTVHDELDFSDPGGKDEAYLEMKNVMENALHLRIPIRADGDIGPNWGELHKL